VHHGKFCLPMSALGQKQTSEYVRAMSALPPKADIRNYPFHACRSSSGSLAIFAAIRRAYAIPNAPGPKRNET